MSSNNFTASSYRLSLGNPLTVLITGNKVGKPNFRVILYQKGLRIITAQITYYSRGTTKNIEVKRINRINRLNELRLHTTEILYPGKYVINITFEALSKIDYSKLDKDTGDLKAYLPVADISEQANKLEIVAR